MVVDVGVQREEREETRGPATVKHQHPAQRARGGEKRETAEGELTGTSRGDRVLDQQRREIQRSGQLSMWTWLILWEEEEGGGGGGRRKRKSVSWS